jgi:hypothetical protein
MSNLIKVLQAIGFSESKIEDIENNHDVEEIVNDWLQDQSKVIKAKFNLKSVEDISNDFRVKENTFKQKVNKLIGMGKTRAEVEQIDFDDFLKEAEAFNRTNLDNLTKNVEESLKNDLTALKEEKVKLTNLIDQITDEKEKTITELKEQFETRIYKKDVDNLVMKGFQKVVWKDDEMKDVFQDYIRKEIDSNYKVNPDGTVLSKDGTPALNLDGKGTYSSILSDDKTKNPILDLAYKKGMVKQSNGGAAATTGTPLQFSDDLTPAARAMMERAQAKNAV